jgi:hypothetical protein
MQAPHPKQLGHPDAEAPDLKQLGLPDLKKLWKSPP